MKLPKVFVHNIVMQYYVPKYEHSMYQKLSRSNTIAFLPRFQYGLTGECETSLNFAHTCAKSRNYSLQCSCLPLIDDATNIVDKMRVDD